MFFKLVLKNGRRSRKENGLFFLSLIVSIIAFYIILSLENQDVMKFLLRMESDAVNKIYRLLPVLYGVSLFLLFFLVYFAGKYQIERRSHELGMYLMMGMRRSKLFAMMMAEDIFNSIFSLLIGIPIAIFLSEMISLITAKVVGLGIIGHRFTLSWKAVLWTFIGFFTIKFFAMLLFSGSVVKKEVISLLSDTQEKKQKRKRRGIGYVQVIAGILSLAVAYYTAIRGNAWESPLRFGMTVVLGIAGTFLWFHGSGLLLELTFRLKKTNRGLSTFTFRQLQENVFLRPASLAVSSLLILAALCCFGYGMSVSLEASGSEAHHIDYTFIDYSQSVPDKETSDEEPSVKEILKNTGLDAEFSQLFEVKTGMPDDENTFSGEGFRRAVNSLGNSENVQSLSESLEYFTTPYFISLSGYNQILETDGKAPIELSGNQAALYSDQDFYFGERLDLLNEALSQNPVIELNGIPFELKDQVYQTNLVVDRSITLALGVIIPDSVYDRLVTRNSDSYWNAVLKENLVQKEGLMQAMMGINERLNQTSLEYESYLQNMGRQLFYFIALGYITIYLAVIFLIIANTVMGVQFLMHQRKTGRRYHVLIRLGSSYKALCKSADKQIKWYFGLPVLTAAVSSFFGIQALFAGFISMEMKTEVPMLLKLGCAMIILLVVVEFIYIAAVTRLSRRQLLGMIENKREE
ncbi:ABC transporter permease [Clostridium sp. AF19-22AC]|jgi:putative ABC transport system permease protein|uniref:FtsX-like permease family protein n=1 Tax=Clostridia TaxID=186801 RepID=UPI000E4C939C|nr:MULTISPECIES: ABC transporter permease [Clostridia]RHR32594.1 ABC transporter permease [Clostridium sp. AF19-22AC]